jgi:hypothetical protein
MSDLVKRLRSYGGDDIRKESADRIEALEAALREIANTEPDYAHHGTLNMQVVRMLEDARAALAPEQDK